MLRRSFFSLIASVPLLRRVCPAIDHAPAKSASRFEARLCGAGWVPLPLSPRGFDVMPATVTWGVMQERFVLGVEIFDRGVSVRRQATGRRLFPGDMISVHIADLFLADRIHS